MNKTNLLFWSSALLVVGSIPFFISNSLDFVTLKMAIALFFIASGVLSFYFSTCNKEFTIPSKFTFIQGFCAVGYGLTLLIFGSDENLLLMLMTYFLLLYGLIEIAFPFFSAQLSSQGNSEATGFQNYFRGC